MWTSPRRIFSDPAGGLGRHHQIRKPGAHDSPLRRVNPDVLEILTIMQNALRPHLPEQVFRLPDSLFVLTDHQHRIAWFQDLVQAGDPGHMMPPERNHLDLRGQHGLDLFEALADHRWIPDDQFHQFQALFGGYFDLGLEDEGGHVDPENGDDDPERVGHAVSHGRVVVPRDLEGGLQSGSAGQGA